MRFFIDAEGGFLGGCLLIARTTFRKPPRNSTVLPVHEIGSPDDLPRKIARVPTGHSISRGFGERPSRTSKKFSNKEIAQGVGFAATNPRSLTYLGIVKNAVEKTERVLAKRNTVSKSQGRPSRYERRWTSWQNVFFDWWITSMP